jgi:hypothetical protein
LITNLSFVELTSLSIPSTMIMFSCIKHQPWQEFYKSIDQRFIYIHTNMSCFSSCTPPYILITTRFSISTSLDPALLSQHKLVRSLDRSFPSVN